MYKFKNYSQPKTPPKTVVVYPKSKPILVMLGCFLVMSALARFFIKEGVLDHELQGIVNGIVMALIPCALIYHLLITMGIYRLEDKKITFRSLFFYKKATITRKDIEAYCWVDSNFILLVKGRSVYISKTLYENVSELGAQVSEGKKSKEALRQQVGTVVRRWFTMAMLMVGLALMLARPVYAFLSDIIQPEMVTITEVLAEKPILELRKSNDRTTQYGLIIHLKGYRGYNFGLRKGLFNHCSADEFSRAHKAGDTVSLTLKKEEYQRVVDRGDKEIGFWAGFFESHSIDFFEVSDSEYSYVSIQEYYERMASLNHFTFWLWMVIGAGLVLVAVFDLSKPIRGQVKEEH